MGKPPARSSKVTLNALLTSGKLTGSEQRVFQQMYDELVQGRIVDLSPKQRVWADAIFEKYKLGEMRATTFKQAKVKVQEQKANFLNSMDRPLKPPGR